MKARRVMQGALVAGSLWVSMTLVVGAESVSSFSTGVTSGSTDYEYASSCSHTSSSAMSVRQTASDPDAIGRYKLLNLRTGTWSSVREIPDNGVGQWSASDTSSHQLFVRRAVPADTNGAWVPGSGVTTFGGRFRCT